MFRGLAQTRGHHSPFNNTHLGHKHAEQQLKPGVLFSADSGQRARALERNHPGRCCSDIIRDQRGKVCERAAAPRTSTGHMLPQEEITALGVAAPSGRLYWFSVAPVHCVNR